MQIDLDEYSHTPYKVGMALDGWDDEADTLSLLVAHGSLAAALEAALKLAERSHPLTKSSAPGAEAARVVTIPPTGNAPTARPGFPKAA